MKNIEEKLSGIINPVTKKTLTEEKRWKSFDKKDGNWTIVYARDGISAEDKKSLENEIYQTLEGQISEENLFIKTISESEGEVKRAATQKKDTTAAPAELKTGHGTVGNKRRVPGAKNVIAISSCKGGVGKSTFTVNLAMSLKAQGKKVGLLDADIYGPSIPMLLGERKAKPAATENKKINPIETKGVKFISFGLFVDEKDPVIWRGPMLGGVLNQFLFDTDWGELDYLLIDLPPGTGDIQLSMVQNTEVDEVIIVTTPQSVAVLDTRKGIEMFKKVNISVAGIVENMSYFAPDDSDKKYYIFGEGGGSHLAKELETNFLGAIPLEIALREGSDTGVPYMGHDKFKERPVWKAYTQIAKKIDNMRDGNTKSPGLLNKLFNK